MKFNKIIQFVILVYFFSSCSSTEYGYSVLVDEHPGNPVSIEYKSHKTLLSEIESKAEIQMWDSARIETETEEVPEGGYIIVRIRASSKEEGNAKYWSVILTDKSGKELLRHEGKDHKAEYTKTQYTTTWWNIEIVPIPFEVKEPLKVYVINGFRNERSEFEVKHNGK